jgi:hypothetical protein
LNDFIHPQLTAWDGPRHAPWGNDDILHGILHGLLIRLSYAILKESQLEELVLARLSLGFSISYVPCHGKVIRIEWQTLVLVLLTQGIFPVMIPVITFVIPSGNLT